MPRGPDWLLGFGFKAKDNGLGAQLKKYQEQFEGLAKSVKNFQKSSKGGSGGRRASGAGFDTEKLSKSVKGSSSKSVLNGLESLNTEVSSVLRNVDKGLAHVNQTGRDIGLSLHKNIEQLFDDIEKGAFKSAKNLEQIPAILAKIPLLAPKTVDALKKMHKELAKNKGDSEGLKKGIGGLRKEIMKAVKDSSGFESVDKKSGLGQVLSAWTSSGDLFAGTMEDAVKGMDFAGGKLKKLFGTVLEFDKAYPLTLKGVGAGLADLGKGIKDISFGTAKWIAKWTGLRGVFNKVLKPIGTFFFKKLTVPATKLGKMFARVPLFDRIFGKKQKLKATRQELDRIGEDLSFTDELEAFNKSTGAGASEKDFAEKLAGDKQELDERMSQAQELGSRDKAKAMASSAEDDPAAAIFAAMEQVEAQNAPKQEALAAKIEEVVEAAAKNADPNGIAEGVSELIYKLKYDVAPAIADELAAIMNLFMHGRKNISEEAVSLNKTISDSFEKIKHAYIEPLARSVGDALTTAKGYVTEFSASLKQEIEGSVSESFTKLRERINRSARTFSNLTKKADEAFFNILLDKEEFVQEFEANFERLADNVGLSIRKISGVTGHEFKEVESALSTMYSNLSTINAQGVVQQTEAISRGFVDLASTLDRITGPIVKNYEAIGAALKKAVGLNPFPVMAILSKLGPALARVGPAAGRAGGAMAGMEGAAASSGGGGAAGDELGEMFKKQATDSAMDQVSGKIMERIGQLKELFSGGKKETQKAPVSSGASEGSTVAIIDALHSMTARLVEELHKLQGSNGKSGGAPAPSSGGKMNINSDEFKKAFSGAMKTIGGLAGHAR